MVRRIADRPGQRLQRQRVLRVGDQAIGLLKRRIVARDLVRLAPEAGPQPRRLGLGAGGEEADILAPRVPRGAGRTAIDAGGEHAGDEASVHRPVAPHHRRPGGLVGNRLRVVHRP